MDWTRRHVVGFSMNTHPSSEMHATTEDGHTLVALLQDDRPRGGGRGIFVRLYGEDPGAPRSSGSGLLSAPADMLPVAPRRLPTFEEIREAVDSVAPAGSHWTFLPGFVITAQPVGTDHPLAAPVWSELPALVEVLAQAPAIQAPQGGIVDGRGDTGPFRSRGGRGNA